MPYKSKIWDGTQWVSGVQQVSAAPDLILNLSATAEMIVTLQSAWERGLCPFLDDDDFDASTALRWWRGDDGVLYATAPTTVEPGARRVSVEWEPGAGWRVVD